MTCKIKALNNNIRMSTQELLELISEKIQFGETDFYIEACGQHDIGGGNRSLKSKTNNINFRISNPGQRVGAMGMEGTKIIVEGSAPADIGWLNSGAKIIVKGDGGDTASHCAAGGKIYIGGRVGTRSGALMKHDPKFEPPQFWVLKNTGSFSFEFMSGGIAIVCGYDCENLPSVLGNRSCVGMVGGTIYVRGNVNGLAHCVETLNLDAEDKEFLATNIKDFLNEIEKLELESEFLNFDNWTKIVPLSNSKKEQKISVKEFKEKEWFEDGLFGDLVEDDGEVYSLAEPGLARIRKPDWNESKCVECNLCINNCPQNAISKNDNKYFSEDEKCIGCGICAAVCPKQAWIMN